MKNKYGRLNMVMNNFINIASSVAIQDLYYKLSPDEKMLYDKNFYPQVNLEGSSLLGEGQTAKVYKVLSKGKPAAAKVSTDRKDTTSIYNLYQIKKILQQDPENSELAKHIMEFYQFFDADVIEDGKNIKKHVAITELLDNPPAKISSFFAYSNKIKILPESQRKSQYRHSVDEMMSSINEHFEKAKLAYNQNSIGVFKDLQNFLSYKQIDFDKDKLLLASKEINKAVTMYLNDIQERTSRDIESIKKSFEGTAIPSEEVIKSKLLKPIENKFINKDVPEFFNNIFYVESDWLVDKMISILQKYDFKEISKEIDTLLEPLLMKSLEIFLTGINISYKSSIETLDYFAHVEEVSSIIKLLKYLKDNNLVGFSDLHHYNIMVRDDGTIILSDPGSFVFFNKE